MSKEVIKALGAAALIGLTSAGTNAKVYDFINGNDIYNVGGAVFTTQSAPNGFYDTFLSIGGQKKIESGFNSDSDSLGEGVNVSETHSLKLVDVGSISYDGIDSYVFKFDMRSINPTGLENLVIRDIEVYTMPNASEINDYRNLRDNANLMYSLEGNSLKIGDSGVNSSDLTMYVPLSNFSGARADDNLIFYFKAEKFNFNNDIPGGFEKWAAFDNTVPEPSVSLMLLGGIGALVYSQLRRKKKN